RSGGIAAMLSMGLVCSGMYFSVESVRRAKVCFPALADRIHQMSAFEMGFDDDAFDVTYHNGFWILFGDPEIHALAKEQARVSRKRMIVTVHNKHNKEFVDYFEMKKQTDPLFDIRFFEVDEIASLMRTVCNDVRVVPVGKAGRKHEDALIRVGLTSPALIRSYLGVSGMRLLDQSERLLCIGKLP